MKRKLINSLRLLLVAAGLCVGANCAWATDAFVQNFTGSSTDPADYGFVVTTSGSSTATVGDGKLTLSAEANGSSDRSAAVTATFSAIGTGNIVTFSCAWNPGGPTGTRAASKLVLQDGSGTAAMTLSNDGQNYKLYLNGSEIASGDSWRSSAIVWNVVATLNITTNKILTLTVTKSGDSDPTVSESNIAFQNSVSSISKFYCQTTKKANWVCTSTLDDVSITYEASSTPTVDYTINYKLGDDVVKTVNSFDDDGVTIYAETAVDGVGTFAGNHYLITANSAPSITLDKDAAENVLDVPVRAPYTATLTVTKNIGGEAQTPEVTNLVETDAKVCSWIYAYPMYIKKGDVYYIADVTSAFGETGNFTDGQSISKTVNYTATAPDVVWFKDIDGATLFNVAYSGGGYTNINEELANVTVDAGVYEVIFNVVSKAGSGSHHRNEGVSVNGNNVANLTGDVSGLRSLRINVAADESVITAYGNGTSKYTDNLDYVLIKKLPSSVSATIGSYGYATFSSTYALDFTDVTDATAYIATSKSGDKIKMQTITGTVAAGTGLVLKSASGSSATINIPVAASGTTYNTTSDPVNYLFAISSNYNLGTPENGTNYVLSVQDEKVVFAPIGATAAPVTAGHAALWIPAVGARMLEMSFADDETTGISQIENGRLNIENSVYNLNGQRVTKPSKGLYIVGGKKVILK